MLFVFGWLCLELIVSLGAIWRIVPRVGVVGVLATRGQHLVTLRLFEALAVLVWLLFAVTALGFV